MYIIIKKDKAEHFSDKLRRVKELVCDIMYDIEESSKKDYVSREEAMRHSYSHHGSYDPYDREREERERYEKDFSRSRPGGGRY